VSTRKVCHPFPTVAPTPPEKTIAEFPLKKDRERKPRFGGSDPPIGLASRPNVMRGSLPPKTLLVPRCMVRDQSLDLSRVGDL